MSHTDRLRQTLSHLHQELDAVSTADPEVRGMLTQTLREIADRLETEQREAQAQQPGTALTTTETIETLRAAAVQFGAEHPQVATAIESVVDALARMGI